MKNGYIFKAFIFGFILNLTIFGIGYGLICAADMELILGTSSAFNVVRGTDVSSGTKMLYVGSSTVSIGTTTQNAAMFYVAGSSTSGNDASLGVRNSSGTDTLSVRNDGAILIGTNTSTLNSALYVGSATSGSLGTITAGFLSMGTISANTSLHGTTTVRFLADILANGTVTASKFSGDGSSLTGITATSLGSTSNINTTGTINAGSTTVSVLTTTGSATVTGTLTAANNTFTVNGNTGSMTASSITVSTGTLTVASGAFKVDENGSMTASRITSTGAFTAGSGNFAVDATGTLTAQRITVSNGTITAQFLSVGTVSTSADGTTTVRFLNDIFANGTITASKFSGDGAGLTGITATGGVTGGNISTSGTISAGSTTVSTLTTTGSATVTGALTAASNTFRADTGSVTVTTRVGIGTSTPSSSYRLQVTDDADLGFVVGSSGSITVKTLTVTGSATVTGTLTAASNTFRADSGSVTVTTRVGIGTTTPSSAYRLQVTDDANLGVVVGSSGSMTAKTLTVTGSATVTGTLTAAVGASSNVGIGTTAPGSTLPNGFASDSTTKILQISGAGTGASADVGLVLRRSNDSAGLDIWNDATEYDSFIDNRIDSTVGDLFFRTRTAGTAVDELTILGTGRVGIRNNAPTARLHLKGALSEDGLVMLEINSNGIVGGNNVVVVRSDVSGADDLVFRVTATGTVFADGAYTGTGADYAEWFEKEGEIEPGDVVGLNLDSGKVKRYEPGEILVGVHSQSPVIVGNQDIETSNEEMAETHALIALLGQVEVDKGQIKIEGRTVYTLDRVRLGYLLANGKILMRIK